MDKSPTTEKPWLPKVRRGDFEKYVQNANTDLYDSDAEQIQATIDPKEKTNNSQP